MTEEQPDGELSIDEEYELWKSNVPLMYDFVSETRLTWPSLTLEWLPGSKTDNQQQMVIGTHTSEEEKNFLKIASIELPNEIILGKHSSSDQATKSNIRVSKKFEHEQEVIRARYMPQNTNIIATVNGSGTVYIYDRSKAQTDGLQLTLNYHKENGYGLSFNPNDKGKLLSGSDDATIALWDINTKNYHPASIWASAHSNIVNDCKWHEFDSNIFGSVSEDCTLQLHDQRENNSVTCKISAKEPFNTLSFSKHSKNLFAAAGTDTMVYLYDARNTAKFLHIMPGHEGSITNLEFSSDQDGIVASSGDDRRIIIWDLAEIGSEQVPDDADDGSPEIMMIHAGHRSPVNDFSMNPNVPWLVASTEEDNVIQVWKCSNKLPRVGGVANVDDSMLE